MISFNYESDFELTNEKDFESWIAGVLVSEAKSEGEINYIFCDDTYLHKLNLEFLKHDTLTDIISFDYSLGNEIHGDIYISVERVVDNSKDFKVSFETELSRVVVHGILHFCGYKDKTETESRLMRDKEDFYLCHRI